MENLVNNSCIMLACALHTPVLLSSVFGDDDLDEKGVELDSHITLLYAAGKTIERFGPVTEISFILDGPPDSVDFHDFLKGGDLLDNIFDSFELDVFENDSDILVLKLKRDNPLYDKLVLINKGLRSKYNVSADYTYTPHITLATLKSGKGKDYVNDESLIKVLEDSRLGFEDLIISYGSSQQPVDRERYNLTTYHAVNRFFRDEELQRLSREIE